MAVKQHLYASFRGNAATRWGHLQEPRSQSRYIQLKSSDLKVHTSGLVVSVTHPWLAASPVNSDLPPEYLKDLMTAFYNTQVNVDKQKADEIEILT